MQNFDFVSDLHKMSRILPARLVFITGYGNTENVFYCLSNIAVDQLACEKSLSYGKIRRRFSLNSDGHYGSFSPRIWQLLILQDLIANTCETLSISEYQFSCFSLPFLSYSEFTTA